MEKFFSSSLSLSFGEKDRVGPEIGVGISLSTLLLFPYESQPITCSPSFPSLCTYCVRQIADIFPWKKMSGGKTE